MEMLSTESGLFSRPQSIGRARAQAQAADLPIEGHAADAESAGGKSLFLLIGPLAPKVVYSGVGPGGVRLTRASFNGGRVGGQSVDAVDGTVRPLAYALYGNAPNPFNPETSIGHALPVANEVELAVYDVVGQRVRLLVSATRPSGMHEVVWDGRDDSGQRVGSGVYFYGLTARGGEGVFRRMRRMRLLK